MIPLVVKSKSLYIRFFKVPIKRLFIMDHRGFFKYFGLKYSSLRYYSVVALLLIIVFVSGCSGPITGGSSSKKYYKGYDSIELKFLEDTPPYMFYYDDTSFDNEIPIVIQVANKGASNAVGGIYIHGYDPHFIQVSGGALPPTSALDGSGNSWTFGGSSNGNYYVGFSGGGFNIGVAGNTNTGNTNVGVGFRSEDGHLYGSSVMTPNGGYMSMAITLNPSSIGYLMAQTTLSGYLSTYAGYNSIIALEGDSPYTPGGGIQVYEFPAWIGGMPESLEEFRQPIMVTACYGYVTKATAMVCIDPNPRSNTKKVCRPSTVSLGGGQGAPIAITSIEQQAGTGKAVFTIHVQHNKKNTYDEVFDYYNLWKCDPQAGAIVKPTDKNIAYVGMITLSGIPLVCTPYEWIRLDQGGSGVISCTATYDVMSTAYEAPLEVELWYGYSKNIYKEILIRKI